MIKNKCKKLISMVISLMMLTSMFSVNVFAGNTTSNPFIESGKCGNNVKYSFDSSTGHLTIYGKGSMYNRHKKKDVDRMSIRSMVLYEMDINYDFSKMLVKSITIGDGVTNIGEGAFYECKELTLITIPNSVTEIGCHAFKDCIGLTEITIPTSVTKIGSNTFEGCTGLESINVSEGNPNYKCVDGVLFSKDGTKLYIYPVGKKINNYTIPNSVTFIGNDAFYEYKELTSITIPNSVTTIDSEAFSGCKGLTSITIPASVTYIGKGAFNNCTNLKSVTYLGKDDPGKNMSNFERIRHSRITRVSKKIRESNDLSDLLYKSYTFDRNLVCGYWKTVRVVSINGVKTEPRRGEAFFQKPSEYIHVPSDYKSNYFCGVKVSEKYEDDKPIKDNKPISSSNCVKK